ncbi:UNVERIFIED_CONTAM: hypothetical protein FKN15_076721 [Acipenser sinensis]
MDRATGAQAGDQAAAAAGRGESPCDSVVTSGSPGGAKQESGRMTVPGGAATWDPGPAMRGPDTTKPVASLLPRCRGRQHLLLRLLDCSSSSSDCQDSSFSFFGPRDGSYSFLDCSSSSGSSDRQAATPTLAFEDSSASYFSLGGR